MVKIANPSKWLAAKLVEVYGEDSQVVAKKMKYLLFINAMNISICLLFAYIRMAENPSIYGIKGIVAANASAAAVIIASVMSIKYIFQSKAKEASNMLIAVMACTVFDMLIIDMSGIRLAASSRVYEPMFIMTVYLIMVSIFGTGKGQIALAAAVGLFGIEYEYFSRLSVQSQGADLTGMVIRGIQFMAVSIFAYVSFDIFHGSVKKIVQAGEVSGYKYRSLFSNMSDGFAYCQILFDEYGKPQDALILEANRAFKTITGCSFAEKESLSEVFKEFSLGGRNWQKKYADVALHDTETNEEIYVADADKWISVHLFSPLRGYLVLLLRDIDEVVKTRERIMESEALHRGLVECSPDAIVVTNIRGRIQMVSPAVSKIFGYETGELIGKDMEILVDTLDRAMLSRNIESALRGSRNSIMEYRGVKKSGEKLDIEVNYEIISGAAKENTRILLINRDATSRKNAEEMFKNIFHSHSSIMFLMDIDSKTIVDANKTALEFYGYPLVGMNIGDISTLESRDIERNFEYIKLNGSMRFDESHRVYSSEIREMNVNMSITSLGEKRYAFAILNDVTEEKRAKNLLERLSVTDALTGIYNRLHFNRELENEIAQAKLRSAEFSMIMFDIDHFKRVNDTYGHDVGDMVLKEVVKIVKEQVRATDVFARWGGEEFIIMAKNTPLRHAKRLAERIRLAIEQNDFEKVGHITCSFGISVLTSEDSESSVAKRADEALYEAKQSGRNCVKVK